MQCCQCMIMMCVTMIMMCVTSAVKFGRFVHVDACIRAYREQHIPSCVSWNKCVQCCTVCAPVFTCETGTSCFSRPRRRCSCWYVPTFASHPRDAAPSSLASQCHHHLLLSLLLHHRHRTSHNVNAQSSAACARGLVTLKRLWLPLNSRQSRRSYSFLCVVLTRVESQVRTLTFAQEVCARCGNDSNAVLSLRHLHFGRLLVGVVVEGCDTCV